MTEGFVFSQAREPHAARARAILRAHRDVRSLGGRNAWSAALIVTLVGIQVALSFLLSGAPVWAILVSAWAVGAFVSHALWVLIHECAHNLVVRSAAANRVFA